MNKFEEYREVDEQPDLGLIKTSYDTANQRVQNFPDEFFNGDYFFLDLFGGEGTYIQAVVDRFEKLNVQKSIIEDSIGYCELRRRYYNRVTKLSALSLRYNLKHFYKGDSFQLFSKIKANMNKKIILLQNVPYNQDKSHNTTRSAKSLIPLSMNLTMDVSDGHSDTLTPHTWCINQGKEFKELRERIIEYGIEEIEGLEPWVFGKKAHVDAIAIKLNHECSGNKTFKLRRYYTVDKNVKQSKVLEVDISNYAEQGFIPLPYDEESLELSKSMKLDNNDLKISSGGVNLPKAFREDDDGDAVYMNHTRGVVNISSYDDGIKREHAKDLGTYRVAYAYLVGMGLPLHHEKMIRDVQVVSPGIHISSKNKYVTCESKEQAEALADFFTNGSANKQLHCISRGSSLDNWMIHTLNLPSNIL